MLMGPALMLGAAEATAKLFRSEGSGSWFFSCFFFTLFVGFFFRADLGAAEAIAKVFQSEKGARSWIFLGWGRIFFWWNSRRAALYLVSQK